MHFDSGDGRELKVDQMLKRSQGKKKVLTTFNYKERVFVLTPKTLRYYGGTKEVMYNSMFFVRFMPFNFILTITEC